MKRMLPVVVVVGLPILAALLASACGVYPRRGFVGGRVEGLVGKGLVLRIEASDSYGTWDDVGIAAPGGSFTGRNSIAKDAAFQVTVLKQPTSPNQVCSVSAGTGVMGTENVADVVVTCSTAQHALGGSIAGLVGTGLVLQNSGGDDLQVTAGQTSFTFPTRLAEGASYAVTIKAQPSSQFCSLVTGSDTGTMGDSDCLDVVVNCITNAHGVGGTLTGLVGSGLVLQNNGGDDLPITASDTQFTFRTPVAEGASYDVSVNAQPSSPAQTCTVAGGSGTMGNGDVTSVVVNCGINAHYVGGTISGLHGTVVLEDNGSDDYTASSDGTYRFGTQVAEGRPYQVAVTTQPACQLCSLSNASGTMGTADVTNVDVACRTPYSTIGGTISGLSSDVLVLTNGTDSITASPGSTAFTFPTALPECATYRVSATTRPRCVKCPVCQHCTVSNAAGTVGVTNVTNVLVSCTTPSHTVSGILEWTQYPKSPRTFTVVLNGSSSRTCPGAGCTGSCADPTCVECTRQTCTYRAVFRVPQCSQYSITACDSTYTGRIDGNDPQHAFDCDHE